MKLGHLGCICLNTAATALSIYLFSLTYIFAFIGMVGSNKHGQLVTGVGIAMYGIGLIFPVFSWGAMFTKSFLGAIILSIITILAGLGAIIFYNYYLAV